jgi:precorrin-6Y C5,15-methyltransferase (decarboxylating)
MTESGDITVIGMDGSPLSSDARTALERANLVVGGARQLRAAELPASVRTITLGPLAPALDALSGHEGPAAVLASGDPGFFGILRAVSERGVVRVGETELAEAAPESGTSPQWVRVVPAVSSVAAAFARVGLPWDDALVVSMHGAGDGRDLRCAANVCRAHPKVALLTGPGAGAAELARELLGVARGTDEGKGRGAQHSEGGVAHGDDEGDGTGNSPGALHGEGSGALRGDGEGRGESGGAGNSPGMPHGEGGAGQGDGEGRSEDAQQRGERTDHDGALGQSPAVPSRTLVVAARLGEAGESVEHLTLRQAASRADFPQPHVVLCLADRPIAPRKRWLAGWNGATGPWALPEERYGHRASQITKAEVRAQVVARLAPSPGSLVWDLGAGSGSVGIECARFGAAVVAVEQDAESCSRISANASAHGVEIAVVCGRAPEVLSALPRPDAVFVGGGGVEVVRAALDFAPRRLVVALAAVERVGEVVALLRSDAKREVDGVLLQASRLTALPGAARNPATSGSESGTRSAHRFAAQNPVFVLWGDLR